MLLLGGAVHSDNRGVSALGLASLANLRRAFPEARLIVASSGTSTHVPIHVSGETFEVEISWIRLARSLRLRGGTRHLDALRKLRRWIPRSVHRWISNRAFEQLQEADVILDISGGDSFTEIYGQQRFQSQVGLKQLVLAMKKPLVLLPQTFGPFTSHQARRITRRILCGSLLVASRDLDGVEQLQQLAGPDIRPRLASCPDVAFILQPVPVKQSELPVLLRRHREGPIIGLNVSGWLYSGHAHIPLSVDYRNVVSELVRWVMSLPQARLLLVPHVFGPNRPNAPQAREVSDHEVCQLVQQQWAARFGDRIERVQLPMGAAELKYLIGHCDFFIGARMHSCIAAASQCIPTATLAYSRKAEGVFGMVGAGAMVVDMRQATVKHLIKRIESLFHQRNRLRHVLQTQMSEAKEAVDTFFAGRLRSVLIDRGIVKGPIQPN